MNRRRFSLVMDDVEFNSLMDKSCEFGVSASAIVRALVIGFTEGRVELNEEDMDRALYRVGRPRKESEL